MIPASATQILVLSITIWIEQAGRKLCDNQKLDHPSFERHHSEDETRQGTMIILGPLHDSSPVDSDRLRPALFAEHVNDVDVQSVCFCGTRTKKKQLTARRELSALSAPKSSPKMVLVCLQ